MKDCPQCGARIKKCNRCKEFKSHRFFPDQRMNADGISGYCFECEKIMLSEYGKPTPEGKGQV